MRSLPGDELVADAKIWWNHAITIRAHEADIWPWLVQLGVPARWLVQLRRSRQRRRPERVADRPGTPAGPSRRHLPDDAEGTGPLCRADCRATPGMVLGDDAGQMSWAFVLEPAGETSTWLITRSRGTIDRVVPGLMLKAFWHPLDFGMQRRQLLNLKRLVETA
jgi:hypothetical protein